MPLSYSLSTAIWRANQRAARFKNHKDMPLEGDSRVSPPWRVAKPGGAPVMKLEVWPMRLLWRGPAPHSPQRRHAQPLTDAAASSWRSAGGVRRGRCSRALADEQMPWAAVHVVQVDERVAPTGDPDRNLTHLRESWLQHSPLPPEQVHAMPVESADLGVPLPRIIRASTRRACRHAARARSRPSGPWSRRSHGIARARRSGPQRNRSRRRAHGFTKVAAG